MPGTYTLIIGNFGYDPAATLGAVGFGGDRGADILLTIRTDAQVDILSVETLVPVPLPAAGLLLAGALVGLRAGRGRGAIGRT